MMKTIYKWIIAMSFNLLGIIIIMSLLEDIIKKSPLIVAIGMIMLVIANQFVGFYGERYIVEKRRGDA